MKDNDSLQQNCIQNLMQKVTSVPVYKKVSQKKEKLNNNEAPGNPIIIWFTIPSKFTAEDIKVQQYILHCRLYPTTEQLVCVSHSYNFHNAILSINMVGMQPIPPNSN
jgi:hypothetical protein